MKNSVYKEKTWSSSIISSFTSSIKMMNIISTLAGLFVLFQLASSSCPHEDPELLRWSDAETWDYLGRVSIYYYLLLE